jgi:hypothetical protein
MLQADTRFDTIMGQSQLFQQTPILPKYFNNTQVHVNNQQNKEYSMYNNGKLIYYQGFAGGHSAEYVEKVETILCLLNGLTQREIDCLMGDVKNALDSSIPFSYADYDKSAYKVNLKDQISLTKQMNLRDHATCKASCGVDCICAEEA